MSARRWIECCLALGLLLSSPWGQAGLQPPEPIGVGMPGRWTDVVLPGTELEVLVRPATDPLVLRITRVAPHGTDWRYDFEYTGLEAGRYDLLDALRRKDGSPLELEPDALPRLPVEVESVLAPGQIKPHSPAAYALPKLGGYTSFLLGAGLLWALLFGGFVLAWHKQRKARARTRAQARPPNLAQRLRPLVEGALGGRLTREQRAQLELGLFAYWRRKLDLEHERPEVALAKLRQHPEAGALLTQLELWLHRPGPAPEVDLERLLAPYGSLPADAMPELDTAVGGDSLAPRA